MSRVLCVLLFSVLVSHVESYKFLVISPVYGYSHMKFMAIIANQLADEGHQVVCFNLLVKMCKWFFRDFLVFSHTRIFLFSKLFFTF